MATRLSHDVLSVPGDISSSDARPVSEVRAESGHPCPMGVFCTTSSAMHMLLLWADGAGLHKKWKKEGEIVSNVKCGSAVHK